MKKITLLLVLAGLSAFAQKKFTPRTSLGMNVPLLIDNVAEFGLKHQFHRNLRFDFSLGGSPETRGKFSNGNYDNNSNYELVSPPVSSDGSYTYYSYQSKKAGGLYGKLALNCVFNLPDFFYMGEEGNFKFFVGPLLALSNFNQSGNVIKTVTTPVKVNSDGTYPNPTTKTIETALTESGTVFGSGFSTGITIANNKDLSCDLGLDILGFKRNSAFQSSSHTVGLGTNLLLRINYNFPSKK